MFDKWICKFVNYFEECPYKHKTITFGDLFITVVMLFVEVAIFSFIGILSCATFGLVYYIIVGNGAAMWYQILFNGFIITCLIAVCGYIFSKMWNTEIAKCNKR